MGNANKNLSKRTISKDSFADISGRTFPGGMGEHKRGAVDSRNSFADDENGSSECRFSEDQNKCLRCSAPLATKARYCRNCYNARRTWMPRRPNRRRPALRRPPSASHTASTDNDVLFVPERNYHNMKGDVRVPNPMYSNLPNRLGSSSMDSTSDSDYDHEEGVILQMQKISQNCRSICPMNIKRYVALSGSKFCLKEGLRGLKEGSTFGRTWNRRGRTRAMNRRTRPTRKTVCAVSAAKGGQTRSWCTTGPPIAPSATSAPEICSGRMALAQNAAKL
ncbi:uncharacterized protein LOC106668529 isoform X1 [Cimex lectularius]|uniref:Uncharacterized protein n=1 Tax=Cimex lectularius TaxID=79782 RepID=A0A8I6RWC7_CIMLE|nr:uncharacterized protein LOC106668529 isoform X1 [Cimex lectularius]